MGDRGSNAKRGRMNSKSSATCKNLQELSDYMWKKHRVYLSKGLAKADFGAIKSNVVNIERLLMEFPALSRLKTGKNQPLVKEINDKISGGYGYATTDMSGAISIDTNVFANKSSLDAQYEADVLSGFHPKGSNSSHAIVHEVGHIMEMALIRLNGAKSPAAAWNSSKEATRVLSEACKAIKKTPYGKDMSGKNLTNDQIVSRVSTYATVDRSEALAECVVDYVANGNKANPLSVQVWNILKRELK